MQINMTGVRTKLNALQGNMQSLKQEVDNHFWGFEETLCGMVSELVAEQMDNHNSEITAEGGQLTGRMSDVEIK